MAGYGGKRKKAKHYPIKSYHPLSEGDTIDLGGKSNRVCGAQGHTPGSIIFIDEADRCLFIGDAFGWMWMPGCSALSAYIDSLSCMIPKLMPYGNFRALDGHRHQHTPAGASLDDLPTAHESAKNMKALCEKILARAIEPAQTDRFFGFKTYTYQDCGTHIVIRKSKIK